MRKKEKDLNAYEKDMVNISNKEKEILESYNEEFVEYNEKVNYDDEEFDYKDEVEEVEVVKPKKSSKKIQEEIVIIEDEETPIEEAVEETSIDEIEESPIEETEENIEEVKKTPNYKKIINIIFAIVVAILIMVAIDVISVGRFNRGPFFAIQTKEYEDGGTKEYIGFGYKVIDYNQVQGRRGKEIGPLNLKYNIDPIDTKDIDLAIEFTEDEETAYKKYYNKFIRVESTLESMDFDNNKIVFGYNDEGGKYTLKFTCDMASETEELVNINVDEKVYVIGTVTSYEFETAKQPGNIILSDCFASK